MNEPIPQICLSQINDNKIGIEQLDLLEDLEDSSHNCSSDRTPPKESFGSKPMTSRASFQLNSKPEFLLIIDTETTGLDPEKHFCLEVGAILFHVSSRSTLAQQSFLIPVHSNDAEAINRIPAKVTRLNQPWEEGMSYLDSLMESADLLVAHNAAFDRQWFGKPPLPTTSKKWLCTMEDISWPETRQLRSRPSVRDLALAYGVPVWNAHRALTDCIYLAEVFSRCEDLEKLIQYGLEPRRLMRARVSYDQRHMAREAGFRWNDPLEGAWSRRLSDREAAKLSFNVEVVKSDFL